MDSPILATPLDRVLRLRTLPMLDRLSTAELAAIAQSTSTRQYPAAAIIQSGDEPLDVAYHVLEGLVIVRMPGATEPRQLKPGDTAGFLEMLSRRDRRLELEAVEDTVVLEWDWDAQREVCEQHFAVPLQYLRYLAAQRLAQMREHARLRAEPVAGIAGRDFGDELDHIERLLILSLSRAFSPGCLDALSELAHHVTEVHAKPGERVWASGAPAPSFLLIASGRIGCTSSRGESFDRHPGNLVGLHEALCGEPRWHDAVSETETLALKIDVEPFVDILEDHFDLALDVLAILADELLENAG